MRKKVLFIVALLFFISFIIVIIYGKTATIEYNIGNVENISINYDKNIIKCDEEYNNGKLKIKISPLKKRKYRNSHKFWQKEWWFYYRTKGI